MGRSDGRTFHVGACPEGGARLTRRTTSMEIREWWGLDAPDAQAVLASMAMTARSSFPMRCGRLAWAREAQTRDPRAREFATRDVSWQPRPGEPAADFGVDVLQQRGAIFLLCRNVLRFVTRSRGAGGHHPCGDAPGVDCGVAPGRRPRSRPVDSRNREDVLTFTQADDTSPAGHDAAPGSPGILVPHRLSGGAAAGTGPATPNSPMRAGEIQLQRRPARRRRRAAARVTPRAGTPPDPPGSPAGPG
jgi:hypothetical protein